MSIELRQNINAMSAHVQWACRPADERYQSIGDLAADAATRKRWSVARDRKIDSFCFVANKGAVALKSKPHEETPILFTNWSFQQACSIISAPSNYLRTLPADLAATNMNHGLTRPDLARDTHQLFVERSQTDGGEIWQLRAITSPDYGRIYNADIAQSLVRIQERNPTWALPMGYKDGQWGAELVPSGAYLGDRDMFIMVIDGNRAIDDPTDTSNGGLFRGIIVRNSEVGAAYLTLDLFYFRRVCGNNIIWGFQHVAGFRRRHVGTAEKMAREFQIAMGKVQGALNSSTTEDRAIIQRAVTRELAAKREDVIDLVAKIPGANETIATNAYAMAEKEGGLNPRSVWGMAQGLTYVSQTTGYQDTRFDIDRAASKLLTKYAA
jgi:hypothetical protein